MWHNVIQNTEEPCPCCGKTWMELRAGKVTGSSIGKVMAKYGDRFGDPAKRLAIDVATVQLGGFPTDSGYSNSHMERGHELEPIARMKYEEAHFADVSNGGFYDNGDTGASVDGIVCGDGLLEIKCVMNSTHYGYTSKKTYDTKYKWQLIFNLKESNRSWIDFVSYCPTYRPGLRLYVYRIKRDDVQEEFAKIDNRMRQFRELVSEIKNNMKKAA